MPLSEFALIDRHFSRCGARRGDVELGIGDDAALLTLPSDRHLVITVDTLVEGVHFLPGADPEGIGWKTLAVSLSDLAAMGATPSWATLAITLPTPDEQSVSGVARGLDRLARRHGVDLVGGDTTRGPFALTLNLLGWVDAGREMRRSGAREGDRIYVTGTLGDAALALQHLQWSGASAAEQMQLTQPPGACPPSVLERLHRPTPRTEEGQWLAQHSRCAIDLSDGLLADLGHLCNASGVGAEITAARLPLSPSAHDHLAQGGTWDPLLAGGDDYELCFTLPPHQGDEVEACYPSTLCPITPIGEIISGSGVHCRMPDGTLFSTSRGGYAHFG